MPRISRKELKKDEFATEVSKTYEFLQQQREKLIRVGVIAAVVALVVVAGYFIVVKRRASANDRLGDAMQLYYPAPGVIDVNYPDDKSRYGEAERRFAAVAAKYSWLKQGMIARYFEGLSAQKIGKTDEAIRQLDIVARKGDEHYSGLAKFALAGVYAQTGKPAEAEKLYRELAQHPTDTVPKETALLALADELSASKPAEAQKIYQELKKEAPKTSAAAEQADKRLADLKK